MDFLERTENERQDGRNIGDRVELPIAGSATFLSTDVLRVMLVHRTNDQRYAQVDEYNDGGREAVLHVNMSTLAAAVAKVKSLHKALRSREPISHIYLRTHSRASQRYRGVRRMQRR